MRVLCFCIVIYGIFVSLNSFVWFVFFAWLFFILFLNCTNTTKYFVSISARVCLFFWRNLSRGQFNWDSAKKRFRVQMFRICFRFTSKVLLAGTIFVIRLGVKFGFLNWWVLGGILAFVLSKRQSVVLGAFFEGLDFVVDFWLLLIGDVH